MSVYDSLFDMVGNTPSLNIPIHSDFESRLLIKMEKFNPGMSVKDRAARKMILQAEAEGLIAPGSTLIESSSGNTGLSIAMFAAARGYQFVCVVDNHTEEEKILLMQVYGATIVRVGQDLPANYPAAHERIAKVGELLKTIPDSYNMNQYDNPHNPDGHVDSTAVEILEDTPDASVLVVGVGTGGTITGTARGIKRLRQDLTVVAVEPVGSILFGGEYRPFYQSGTGSSKIVYKNVDHSVVDQSIQVSDSEAFTTSRFLSSQLGLLFGGSSGATFVAAARRAARSLTKEVVVAIIPDGGEKYMSTIYDDNWYYGLGFHDPATIDELHALIDVQAFRSAVPKYR